MNPSALTIGSYYKGNVKVRNHRIWFRSWTIIVIFITQSTRADVWLTLEDRLVDVLVDCRSTKRCVPIFL